MFIYCFLPIVMKKLYDEKVQLFLSPCIAPIKSYPAFKNMIGKKCGLKYVSMQEQILALKICSVTLHIILPASSTKSIHNKLLYSKGELCGSISFHNLA